MIHHIVMWRFKSELDGIPKAALLQKAKDLLEALPESIHDIRDFRVGINAKPSDAAADLVLVSAFDDWAALDRYQQHPAHLAVGDYIKAVATERRVVDDEGNEVRSPC